MFQIFTPKGELSQIVQGIWVASVPPSIPEPIVKHLYPDAGNGVIFNLGGNISIGEKSFSPGIVMLPIDTEAQTIHLPAGTNLAGIRFTPAAGYGLFSKRYSSPVQLHSNESNFANLHRAFITLKQQENSDTYIDFLVKWLEKRIKTYNPIPIPVYKTFYYIIKGKKIGEIIQHIGRSQRQLERLFHIWLGMTPKQFQRILRVNKAINYLKNNINVDLATVAIDFGFSDQSHMTREFRCIAFTTPNKILDRSDSYTKLLNNDKS